MHRFLPVIRLITCATAIGTYCHVSLRFSSINRVPDDHNRVVLSTNEENPDGYMNASLIKLPGGRTQFIAAQAPLPNTVDEW